MSREAIFFFHMKHVGKLHMKHVGKLLALKSFGISLCLVVVVIVFHNCCSQRYLGVSDKSRDAASYMLSKFMTRHDVREKKLAEFLDFSLRVIQQPSRKKLTIYMFQIMDCFVHFHELTMFSLLILI